AVDTLKPYQEIDLGMLDATSQTWTAPYQSDWAIAIGSFSSDLPDPVEPDAPSGLEASAIAPGRIDLAWNAPYTGGSPITGYRIQRKAEDAEDFIDLERDTGNAGTTYIDFSVNPDTTYTYRISAINEIGESPFSNTASATAGDFSQSPLTLTDFGAVGDGAADDTQALREAIAHAADRNLPLTIPVGDYLITEDIVIDRPIHFVGEGNGASDFTSNGGDARFYIRESGTSFTDIGFKEMIAPIVLESRSGYLLENITFDRCRFENIQVHHGNRGVIGLARGRSSERPHPIRNLVIRESIFKNIDSNAINIRGNIAHAQIVDNEFTGIINDPETNSSRDTFVIRLGDPGADYAAGQGHHLITGNTIRNIRKSTAEGNLIGILLYGDSNVIRENLIENIDGTDDGLDTSAIFISGSFNEIIDNTIRNIRGVGSFGAIHLQGEMTEGNRQNIVADNTFENIHGMFAIESHSSDFTVSDNEIRHSPVGALAHRAGTNLSVSGNTFSSANVLVQTAAGEATFSNNEFLESALILSENLETVANRNQILVNENLFRRTEIDSPNPMIQLSDNVAENKISIYDNRFEDLTEVAAGSPLIDLSSGGTLATVKIVRNEVVLPNEDAEFAATDSPNETISDNEIVYGVPSPSLDETLHLEKNRTDDSFSLSWNGKAGFQYQVQFSPDLKNWSPHGDSIPGNDREIRVNDLPTGAGDSMFYRVIIEESDA
ncbi:MAG TPA: fibronectin type III domain-containing protein, partial [Opitutales bacterium]|nr:fibronectin type III domain-containing protein [Opitutales bacterium]